MKRGCQLFFEKFFFFLKRHFLIVFAAKSAFFSFDLDLNFICKLRW